MTYRELDEASNRLAQLLSGGRVRGSVWRCCFRVPPKRSWRYWRCSRPGRRICRSTRRIPMRGSSSCSPMPRRSRRSPPRVCVAAGRARSADHRYRRPPHRQPPHHGACRAGARYSPTSSTPRAPPVRPKGLPSPITTSLSCWRLWTPTLLRARAGVDAVSFLGLRRLGLGDLGCLLRRRATGGGVRVGGALAGGLPRVAGSEQVSVLSRTPSAFYALQTADALQPELGTSAELQAVVFARRSA